MTLSTRITKPLAALMLALAIGGATLAAAPAAQASTPCNTAPNYCHIDSDAIVAVTTGASLQGRLFWETNRTSHFWVTLTDTLRSNNMMAAAQWRYQNGSGNWSSWMNIQNAAVGATGTWTSYTQPNMSVPAGWQVQFRTRQGPTASWAYDNNQYLGD